MCIFHVTSKTDSFKEFLAAHPQLPVYQSHDKGEKPKIAAEESIHTDYGFSCEVSERSWDDVDGQIIDMISFLEVYSAYFTSLKDSHKIDDWRFDLPYECELEDTQFTQCNYFPPKLMRLTGALDIGIELSLYWPSADEEEDFEIDDDYVSADSNTDD
jgi:hypothetical protein